MAKRVLGSGSWRSIGRNVARSAAAFFIAQTMVAHAWAEEEAKPPQSKVAKAKAQYGPSYPIEANRSGEEGWARFVVHVGADGRVKDLFLVSTSSEVLFADLSRTALERWTFEPATLNGTAVEAAYRPIVLSYVLDNDYDGVPRPFRRAYQQTLRSINRGDQEAAKASLAALNEPHYRALYERSYLSFLNAVYSERFGELDAALDHLNRGLMVKASDLTSSRVDKYHQARFLLAIRTGDYGQALEAFDDIERPQVLRYRRQTEELAEKLEQFVDDGHPFAISARTENPCPLTCPQGPAIWTQDLVQSSFYFSQFPASEDSFILACDHHWEEVAYQPLVSWHLPTTWGICRILIQSAAEADIELVSFGTPQDAVATLMVSPNRPGPISFSGWDQEPFSSIKVPQFLPRLEQEYNTQEWTF